MASTNVYLSVSMQNSIAQIRDACEDGFEGDEGERVKVEWSDSQIVAAALTHMADETHRDPRGVAKGIWWLRANGEL